MSQQTAYLTLPNNFYRIFVTVLDIIFSCQAAICFLLFIYLYFCSRNLPFLFFCGGDVRILLPTCVCVRVLEKRKTFKLHWIRELIKDRINSIITPNSNNLGLRKVPYKSKNFYRPQTTPPWTWLPSVTLKSSAELDPLTKPRNGPAASSSLNSQPMIPSLSL